MPGAQFLIERLLQRASTRARGESPHAGAILTELAGKRLAIQISGTPWESRPIVVESNGHSLGLASPPADASIIGAPLALLALLRGEPEALIRRGDVRIEGDPQLAQRFRELGQLLAPDLEQGLSRLVGRSVAHVLVGAARGAAHSGRTAAWTSVRNLAEYLAHESGDLVSRREAEHFLRGVEQLREQLDRLEARLTHLEHPTGSVAGGLEPL